MFKMKVLHVGTILACLGVLVLVVFVIFYWPEALCQCDQNIAADMKMENVPWFQDHLNIYNERNSSTLVLLHIIVRHGDRTNIKECQYPNDPYKNETYMPYGFGALTNRGRRRIYEVGRGLHYEYYDFLQDYEPEELEAISSEIRRCQDSLALLLSGLYPPKPEFVWMQGINWQPIKINSMSGKDNLLGNPRHHCSHWKKYFEESLMNFQDVMSNYSNYFDRLQNFTGLKRDLLTVNILYHSIITNLEWGYEPHISLKEFWPEPTTTLNGIFWKSFSYTDEQKQALVGELIEKIIGDSIQKINNLSKKKLHIYSCSDFNIIGFLSLLGQNLFDNPSYGSHIIIELHKTFEDLYYLQFFYRSNFDSPKIQLEIPECKNVTSDGTTMCLFDNFVAFKLKYFLQDNIC